MLKQWKGTDGQRCALTTATALTPSGVGMCTSLKACTHTHPFRCPIFNSSPFKQPNSREPGRRSEPGPQAGGLGVQPPALERPRRGREAASEARRGDGCPPLGGYCWRHEVRRYPARSAERLT